jgi:hypothetical protein
VEVGAGVAIIRGIAAADVTALEAQAQMHPAIAGFEAFFAALGMRLDFLYVFGDVGAGGWRHGDLRVAILAEMVAARPLSNKDNRRSPLDSFAEGELAQGRLSTPSARERTPVAQDDRSRLLMQQHTPFYVSKLTQE